MSTSHHRDGPDSILLSGPLPGLQPSCFGGAGFAAFSANDNLSRRIPERPAEARAVILCQEQNHDGAPVIAIRLLLRESETSPVLYVAQDSSDIIALWRASGQSMNLPLALMDAGGRISFATDAPGATSFARRGGSPLSGRRPRVMRRRQPPLKAFVFKRKTKKA